MFRSASQGREPAGALRRCGGVNRSNPVAEPVHLLLHLRPRRSAWAWICRCAIDRTARSTAMRFMKRAVDAVRPPGPLGARGSHTADLDRRAEGDRSRRCPVTALSRTTCWAKFIEGREVVDYPRLLSTCRPVCASAATGERSPARFNLQAGGSALRVGGLVPWESPLYKAGVAQDDQLVESRRHRPDVARRNWDETLARHKAGRPRAAAIRATQRRDA